MTVVRLVTTDEAGRPVATTTQNVIHLGVPAEGPDRADPAPPPPLTPQRIGTPTEHTVEVDHGRAHLYTEGARIWNPIHTDRSVAVLAGLPDVILHGTANLGFGVSAVIEGPGGGRPELIRRIVCRFRAMVAMPSALTVRVWPKVDAPDGGPTTVAFEVLNAAGEPAVQDGLIVLGEPVDD
jgi:acyl dehydratase